jgi:serine/threonine protein kinase
VSTGGLYAMKIVDKHQQSDIEINYLMRELYLLREVQNPYIIRLEELLYDDSNFYIITELCSGSNLQTEIDKRN